MPERGRPRQEAGAATNRTPQSDEERSGQAAPAGGNAPIHILVANLPDVVRQVLVKALQSEPDMSVRTLPLDPAQSRLDRVQDLLLAAKAGQEVLVLGVEQIAPLPPVCSHLLSAFPDLKIIAIAENGEAAMLYWLGLRTRHLRVTSTKGLVRSIRRAYLINPTS